MRIKKPQPFEPGRQYNSGERSVYRDSIVVAETWFTSTKRIVEKFGMSLYRCGCCAIKKEDCPAVGLRCHCTSRTDGKTIYFRFVRFIKNRRNEKNIDLIKSRLTPFDAETILMIKSVNGHEPEITEKAESFELKMRRATDFATSITDEALQLYCVQSMAGTDRRGIQTI